MKWLLIFAPALLVGISTTAQFKGGANDGYFLNVRSGENPLPNIYRGGNNDGYNLTASPVQNMLPNIFSGGNNDGYSFNTISGQNTIFNIYTGGNNDGFSFITVIGQNLLPGIYKGGSNDGYSFIAVNGQNLLPGIYTGGSNDGHSLIAVTNQNPICNSINAIWNGYISMQWENPSNWDCGILPGINSRVIISAGLPRYPVVSFSYEIRSLYIQPGASVIILSGVDFKINGQ